MKVFNTMNNTLQPLIKLTLLGVFLTMSGCATIYSIPGVDRLINHFSKAEVGPVKTINGEVIQGTEVKPLEAEKKKTETNNVTKSVPKVTKTATTKSIVKATAKPKKKHKPSVKTQNNIISGNVKLLANSGVVSPEGVIVRLNRIDGAQLQKHAGHASHQIDMLDKTYAPSNIVINKGDTVNFVNKDAIKHNVFSSTGDNAFDLGTFGSNLQREVKLNEEGVVKVYCNIHSNMATFVAVDDKGISQVVKPDDGSFKFTNLPVGEYQLTLWSVRGEQTQKVTLAAQQKLHLNLNFDTSSYEPPKHTNKYGKTYEKKNTRREYY